MDTNEQNPYEAPVDVGEVKPAEDQAELGTQLTRLGAAVLDTMIMLVITVPLMFLTGYVQRAMSQQTTIVDVGLHALVGIVIYKLLHQRSICIATSRIRFDATIYRAVTGLQSNGGQR